jgi:hypothetical protein
VRPIHKRPARNRDATPITHAHASVKATHGPNHTPCLGHETAENYQKMAARCPSPPPGAAALPPWASLNHNILCLYLRQPLHLVSVFARHREVPSLGGTVALVGGEGVDGASRVVRPARPCSAMCSSLVPFRLEIDVGRCPHPELPGGSKRRHRRRCVPPIFALLTLPLFSSRGGGGGGTSRRASRLFPGRVLGEERYWRVVSRGWPASAYWVMR